MLPVSWDAIRLFLHVLAATIWVGGQLVLAALVPVLRRFGADATRAAARRFNQVAWSAFAVLIVTGIWNVAANSAHDHDPGYRTTLIVKLVVVAISGLTAALHARSRTPRSRAAFGALTGLSALAALFLGVLLAGLPRSRLACRIRSPATAVFSADAGQPPNHRNLSQISEITMVTIATQHAHFSLS
jgi:putative copper export protein